MDPLSLLLICLALPVVSGEAGRFEVYGGQALQGDADLTVVTSQNSSTTLASASFDPSFGLLLGLRFRGGDDDWPVALAIDIGRERSRSPLADLELMPSTVALALPARLTLGKHPRLHPTGMLGMTWTTVSGHSPLSSQGLPLSDVYMAPFEGRNTGLTATAGLEWQMTRNVALFGEYRYQDMRFSESVGPYFNTYTFDTTAQASSGHLRSSGIAIGLSFRTAMFEGVTFGTGGTLIPGAPLLPP